MSTEVCPKHGMILQELWHGQLDCEKCVEEAFGYSEDYDHDCHKSPEDGCDCMELDDGVWYKKKE